MICCKQRREDWGERGREREGERKEGREGGREGERERERDGSRRQIYNRDFDIDGALYADQNML